MGYWNFIASGDQVAPTVLSITATNANGTYGVGDTVGIQLIFSEAVIVTGTPQLTLETGSSDAVVNYTSGSGTSTLLFNYGPAFPQGSSDLDANSLALNGGTIQDAASNNANLALPAGSLASNKNIVIDTFVHATGGTVTTDGDFKVHTFNSGADLTVTAGGNVQLLLIAGGGGGADDGGGGGGAGEVVPVAAHALTIGTFTAVIGAGGAGGSGSGSGGNGTTGSNSTFSTLTARGGGGGGAFNQNGKNGGSGGGAPRSALNNGFFAGTSTAVSPGLGFAGGRTATADFWTAASGGGGAGAIGSPGLVGTSPNDGKAGDGGIGYQSSISGSAVYYGGGGGGARFGDNLPALLSVGGLGGGGNGGDEYTNATAGSANTGGGGGGTRGAGDGKAGGSGKLIARYRFQ